MSRYCNGQLATKSKGEAKFFNPFAPRNRNTKCHKPPSSVHPARLALVCKRKEKNHRKMKACPGQTAEETETFP